jgi:hypothetical protein
MQEHIHGKIPLLFSSFSGVHLAPSIIVAEHPSGRCNCAGAECISVPVIQGLGWDGGRRPAYEG